MTNMDMLMGMSFIDDRLVDEALRAKRSDRALILRWGLIAACIAAIILVSILAFQSGGLFSRQSGILPEQISDPNELPTSVTGTPRPDNSPNSQRQQQTPPPRSEDEVVLPVPTSKPFETEDPAESPAPTDSAQSQNRNQNQNQTPRGGTGTSAPDSTSTDRPQETTPGETASPTTRPEQMDPQPYQPPEQTSQPEPPASLEPSGPEQLEPSADMEEHVPADQSYYLNYAAADDADGVISVSLIKYQDSPPFIYYDTEYTDILCEADGFEILSRENVSTGVKLLLKISPELPEGRAAALTFRVKNGNETKTTMYFYGISTDRGIFFDKNSHTPWVRYYRTLYREGVYTYDAYRMIYSIITQTQAPVLEDPIPAYREQIDSVNKPDGTASGESSGEQSTETPADTEPDPQPAQSYNISITRDPELNEAFRSLQSSGGYEHAQQFWINNRNTGVYNGRIEIDTSMATGFGEDVTDYAFYAMDTYGVPTRIDVELSEGLFGSSRRLSFTGFSVNPGKTYAVLLWNSPADSENEWITPSSSEITPELLDIFDRAIPDLGDMVTYEPIAYLGYQISSGTNHLFEAQVTTSEGNTVRCLYYIYEDADGSVWHYDTALLAQ